MNKNIQIMVGRVVQLIGLALRTQPKQTTCRHFLLVFATTVLTAIKPTNATAQCDWIFYADSLTKVGELRYEVSRESIDVDGTKYLYAYYQSGLEIQYRITKYGEVFWWTLPWPIYRLCDTIGSTYMSNFFEGNSSMDSVAFYMHYLGLQPYHTLGQTRLCKVFLEYYVRYTDTITEEDTTQPVDIYAWDIDSDGTPELVMPVKYHILADSLGKVDEIDYHHQWVHNEVVGIWFGSRFVGDPLVGVAGYNQATPSLTLRCSENGMLLSGIPEADVGTMATLELYDLYGRLRTTQRIALVNNLTCSIPAGVVASGDLCAWVLSQSNGTVSRGVVVVE